MLKKITLRSEKTNEQILWTIIIRNIKSADGLLAKTSANMEVS